jgi:hypothetical protein
MDRYMMTVIAQFVARKKAIRSNWLNRNLSHPMSPRWGGSFSLGKLGPGETSPVTCGFEEAEG